MEFYSGLLSRGGCGYSAFFVGKRGRGRGGGCGEIILFLKKYELLIFSSFFFLSLLILISKSSIGKIAPILLFICM